MKPPQQSTASNSSSTRSSPVRRPVRRGRGHSRRAGTLSTRPASAAGVRIAQLTVQLSKCWRSEREEAPGEHDHVQCVPKWPLALTFAQVKALPPEVCKTVASTLPATACPLGPVTLPSSGGCALEWLIWAPCMTVAPDIPRAPSRRSAANWQRSRQEVAHPL